MTACVLAMVLAALDPAVVATPSATPAPIAKCLMHICLGDDINQVFARLGDGTPPSRLPPGIFSNFDSYGSLMVTQKFAAGSVVVVSMELTDAGTSEAADPYGIKIGDTTDTLQRVRGAADQTGDVWRYGPVDRPHWLYAIKGGAVASITVTSLANVPD